MSASSPTRRTRRPREAFVEFLLSEEGQQILLDPKIQRLPVRLATYDKAPAGYPNPFKDTQLGAKVKFDADVSESALRTAQLAVRPAGHLPPQGAQRRLEGDPRRREEARRGRQRRREATARRSAQARHRRCRSPRRKRADPAIAGSFQEVKKGQKVAGRQAEFEQKWDAVRSRRTTPRRRRWRRRRRAAK